MSHSTENLPPTPQKKISSSPFQGTPRIERTSRNQLRHSDCFINDRERGVNVQVIVRCRPFNEDEVRANVPQGITCNEQRREVTVAQNVMNKAIDKTYMFDKVFGPKAQQKALYDQAISPVVNEVLEGYNCTIFAYGQTGTGKTYTMEGGGRKNYSKNGDLPRDAGVIPRAVRQIIDTLESQSADYSLKVTFAELYNEEITDLLATDDCSKNNDDKSKRPIQLMEDGKGGVIVRGLEEEIVYSADEIFTLLERGSSKRRTAETLLNKQSSRSHSIFSITIHIKEMTPDGEELIRCGKLNLVDLAGSENISRSGARELGRAREAGEINKSLLTLGRVITSLVEHLGHIPYRDSKLTRLLRDSLGGKTKTCIIATVSPSAYSLDETMNTIDYAHRAKSIKNKPEVNQKMLKTALIKDLYGEIDRLKQEVRAARDKNGIYIPRERYLQDEEEKKALTEKIDKLEFELDSKLKKIEQLQEVVRYEKERGAMLNSDLKTVEAKLFKTEESLAFYQEKYKQANYEIKQKDFIISNILQSEKSLLLRATDLRSDLENCTRDIDGLFAKIERKNKIEAENHALVKSFRTQLSHHLDAVHCSIVGSMSQQQQQLTTMEEELQSFISQKDQAAGGLKNNVQQLKATYMSRIKDLNKLIGTLEKQSMSTSGKLNETVSNHSSNLVNALATAVSESETILGELQGKFVKQEQRMATFVLKQQERIKRTVESTREIAEIIAAFFENLDNHATDLSKYIEEARNGQVGSLKELQESYEDCAVIEEKRMLEKIAEIMAASTATKTLLVQKAVNKIRDKAANNAHELQRRIVDMKNITSNAHDKWNAFAGRAEDNFVQDVTVVETGHQEFKETLQECDVKISTVKTHWMSKQADIAQLEKRNVEEVDLIVKSAIKANQVLLADASKVALSAETECSAHSDNLLVAINDSLKMDHAACQALQPVISGCKDGIAELEGKHLEKMTEISQQSDKCLQEEYLVDKPTCSTPKARVINVPTSESIEKLRTPPFEELLQGFSDAQTENASKLPTGETKALYSPSEGTPVRPPFTTIN